jgi:hypothetical protein
MLRNRYLLRHGDTRHFQPIGAYRVYSGCNVRPFQASGQGLVAVLLQCTDLPRDNYLILRNSSACVPPDKENPTINLM